MVGIYQTTRRNIPEDNNLHEDKVVSVLNWATCHADEWGSGVELNKF
jgi:hypothetical protein